MRYFSDIADAAKTIFEGLAITASHMLRRPITVQYPDRIPVPIRETMAPRYRGFLEVDMKICTGCTLCMLACPIQCIDIQIAKGVLASGRAGVVDAETPARQHASTPIRLISKFDIDISKCMFCGLCTEPCPTGAIRFSREFERATPDLGDLMFSFVEEGRPAVPYKKGAS